MTEPLELAPPAEHSAPPASRQEAALVALLPGAYAAALRLTGDETEAAALLQEAVPLGAREGTTGEGGIVLGVLSQMIRIYRRNHARPRPASPVDLDDTPDLFLYARSIQCGLPCTGPDPAARLLDALGPDRVARALDYLPEDYRVPCILSLTCPLSYRDLGRVLDCPAGAVRARLHRGRKMLQKTLWQVAVEDGIVETLGGRAG